MQKLQLLELITKQIKVKVEANNIQAFKAIIISIIIILY